MRLLKKGSSFNTLSKDGGDNTFLRYMDICYSESHNEVAEIDPEVTKTVYDKLALPRDTEIMTYYVDGRW